MTELIQARDTENFIELSKKRYNGLYTYENTNYKGEFSGVYIRCIKHDKIIKVKPYFHLNSTRGCKECNKNINN